MGFPRQEHGSGLSFPTPGHLPSPGTESTSLASSALADGFFTIEPPGKPPYSFLGTPNLSRFLLAFMHVSFLTPTLSLLSSPHTLKPSDSFLSHPGLSLDGASAGRDLSHCPGGLLLAYTCGFMMKRVSLSVSILSSAPKCPHYNMPNSRKEWCWIFFRSLKNSGSSEKGTETPIPPCKCTKPCSGSFLYSDSFLFLLSICVGRAVVYLTHCYTAQKVHKLI